MWGCNPWALVPPTFSVSTAAGLWLVYFIAVENKQIVPLGSHYWRGNGSLYPPFISIAGNSPPASCIFSQVMNMAAFVGFIVAVLRYFQLKPRVDVAGLNVTSLAAFSMACFGMTLIGNFQLFSQEGIHNLGTTMTFGLGTLFCWIQSYITLKVNLRNEGKKVGVARLLLSGSISVCAVLYPFLLAQDIHMPAARCQWALVMFLLLFFCTFAAEFRHYRFSVCVACSEISRDLASTSGTFSEVSRSQADQL